MYGTLNERQRMNLPAGMSELDLLVYSPTLYDLYRNEGSGYDKDAFRFDPVVATGMLASDIEYGSNMAWVNYMTPESQAMLNPGDNLIVPVNTYDNYDQLPPWEKRLSHEVSFKGNNVSGRGGQESGYTRDLLNIQASNVGMQNGFVGDFSYYFNEEARILGMDSSVVAPSGPRPVGTAIDAGTIGIGVGAPSGPRPIGTAIEVPGPIGIGQGTPTPIAKYRCINVSPWCVRDDVNGTLTRCMCPSGVSSGGSGGVGAGEGGGTGTGTGTGSGGTGSGGTGTGTGTGTGSGSGGTGTGSGTGEGGAESGGELPPMGGGGGGVGGGGGEAPAEEQPAEKTAEKPATPTEECKLDYTPIIIALIAGLAIAYLIAKKQNKDVKTFGAVGAIIGGILGYIYSRHQCTPIEALTKVGIKSKSESSYYGGR